MIISVVVMLVLFTPLAQPCVNSCCQSCLPDQCEVCYKLNSNPVMCPCVGEIVTDSQYSVNQSHVCLL